MSIELTSSAAEEIRQVLREQGDEEQAMCLRVGVRGHGPQRRFTLELTEPDAEHPVLVESQGVRINYGEADRTKLEGVTIDFQDVGGSRGFVFKLPSHDKSVTDRQADPGLPPPDEQEVRRALRGVIDPEVGINIVDLGLVYGVTIDGHAVRITMTMTTPACPLSEHIKSEVNARLFEQCPGVNRVEVEIVWQPPWNPDKISPEARQTLGWSR